MNRFMLRSSRVGIPASQLQHEVEASTGASGKCRSVLWLTALTSVQACFENLGRLSVTSRRFEDEA